MSHVSVVFKFVSCPQEHLQYGSQHRTMASQLAYVNSLRVWNLLQPVYNMFFEPPYFFRTCLLPPRHE
jgi:hypothetical protein